MKVLIIGNMRLEEGRGPIYRLLHILPFLNQWNEMIIASLGPFDELSTTILKKENIKTYEISYKTRGWFVLNKHEIEMEMISITQSESPDLIVLAWELWDVMEVIGQSKELRHIPFATVFHSVPFVDAVPKPTFFLLDVILRLCKERDHSVRNYILQRIHTVKRVLGNTHIITINETVNYYLNHYFMHISPNNAIPGYALDIENIVYVMNEEHEEKTFDFSYMAKLERNKGIYELLDIVHRMKASKPNVKVLVIGSFSKKSDEREVARMINELRLEENIILAGWADGASKYKLLKQSKVFLYPSISADTFSICLLEALACGLPTICYDVPFSRLIYQTEAVQKVPFKRNSLFAKKALEVLKQREDDSKLQELCKHFVESKYSSWQLVAEQEHEAYQRIAQSHVPGIKG